METYTRDSDGKKFKLAKEGDLVPLEIRHSHTCDVCHREAPEPVGSRKFLTGSDKAMCRTCWCIWYDGEVDVVKIKNESVKWKCGSHPGREEDRIKPIDENPMTEKERDLDSYTEGVCDGMENMKHEIITLFLAECDGADRKLIQDGHIWITWDEIKQIAARLKGEG